MAKEYCLLPNISDGIKRSAVREQTGVTVYHIFCKPFLDCDILINDRRVEEEELNGHFNVEFGFKEREGDFQRYALVKKLEERGVPPDIAVSFLGKEMGGKQLAFDLGENKGRPALRVYRFLLKHDVPHYYDVYIF
jgi:hypothetical protein